MSGQQFRGDSGGDASRQSEEQYGDANSELHDGAPFASAYDSRPHPATVMNQLRPARCGLSHERRGCLSVAWATPRNNCCIATLQADTCHPRGVTRMAPRPGRTGATRIVAGKAGSTRRTGTRLRRRCPTPPLVDDPVEPGDLTTERSSARRLLGKRGFYERRAGETGLHRVERLQFDF